MENHVIERVANPVIMRDDPISGESSDGAGIELLSCRARNRWLHAALSNRVGRRIPVRLRVHGYGRWRFPDLPPGEDLSIGELVWLDLEISNDSSKSVDMVKLIAKTELVDDGGLVYEAMCPAPASLGHAAEGVPFLSASSEIAPRSVIRGRIVFQLPDRPGKYALSFNDGEFRFG